MGSEYNDSFFFGEVLVQQEDGLVFLGLNQTHVTRANNIL
jgi:hypothetical protein